MKISCPFKVSNIKNIEVPYKVTLISKDILKQKRSSIESDEEEEKKQNTKK